MLCTLDVLSRVFTGGLWRWNTFNYWLIVVMLISGGQLLRLRGTELRLFQFFLLFLAAGLTVSDNLALGAQHILDGIALFGLLLYFRRVRWEAGLAYALAISTGVLAAVGGLVFFLARDRLAYVNPNAWSFFPLTAIFASCLAVATGIGSRRRLSLLLSLTSINGVWVFFSESRGGLMIAVACFAFLLIRLRRWGLASVVGVVLAGVLAFTTASLLIEQKSRTLSRVGKLFDTSKTLTERTSGRSDLALGAWYVFLDHPFGIGTGGFAPAWAGLINRAGLSGFGQGSEVSAHSGWAKTLAENGFLGIALLAAFVLSFAFVGWHRGRSTRLLIGGLVTAVLSLGFSVTEFQGKGLWFLAAGVMSLPRPNGPLTAGGSRRRRTSIVSSQSRNGHRRLA
jgi:O-antigen ligase